MYTRLYKLNAVCLLESEGAGMRQSELVNWYLEEIQDELESQEDLALRKTIIERVIQRLVTHVRKRLLNRQLRVLVCGVCFAIRFRTIF